MMYNCFKNKEKTISRRSSVSFNVNPKKYEHCHNFLSRLTTFFDIESYYNSNYHYIAINEDDGKLYEIHTRVIGFEGEYTHTKAVLDFVSEPREITIKNFLCLVDSIYPELSILYSGINESNLKSYQNLMKDWLSYHKKEDWIPLDISKRTLTYEYQILYDERDTDRKNSEIYPLTALSALLIEKGFDFQDAVVGGGIDEITHAGTKAYFAKYLQFEDFRDNCINDIKKAGEEIEKKYQGYATIDYRYIRVTLKKDSLKVCATKENPFKVIWTNPDTVPLSFIREINEKMMHLLGRNVNFQEYYTIKP